MESTAKTDANAAGEKLTVEEVTRRYPNEWVALRDVDVENTYVTAGVVYAHHPDRHTLHQLSRPINGGAVFFTGKIRGRLPWE